MARIGRPEKIITIEPLEVPVPVKQPAPVKEPVPARPTK